jgi:hypothetical protein
MFSDVIKKMERTLDGFVMVLGPTYPGSFQIFSGFLAEDVTVILIKLKHIRRLKICSFQCCTYEATNHSSHPSLT